MTSQDNDAVFWTSKHLEALPPQLAAVVTRTELKGPSKAEREAIHLYNCSAKAIQDEIMAAAFRNAPEHRSDRHKAAYEVLTEALRTGEAPLCISRETGRFVSPPRIDTMKQRVRNGVPVQTFQNRLDQAIGGRPVAVIPPELKALGEQLLSRRLPVSKVIHQMREWWREHLDSKVPSPMFFRRRLKTFAVAAVAEYQSGGVVALKAKALEHGRVPADFPNHTWVLDEFEMPLYIKAWDQARSALIAVKPWVVLIVDQFSGAILSYHVTNGSNDASNRQPTEQDVLAAIVGAALPDVAPPACRALAGAFPYVIRWDKALSHERLRPRLAGLNVHIPDLPANQPYSRGIVESAIHLVQMEFRGKKGNDKEYRPHDAITKRQIEGDYGNIMDGRRYTPILVESLWDFNEFSQQLDEAIERVNARQRLRDNTSPKGAYIAARREREDAHVARVAALSSRRRTPSDPDVVGAAMGQADDAGQAPSVERIGLRVMPLLQTHKRKVSKEGVTIFHTPFWSGHPTAPQFPVGTQLRLSADPALRGIWIHAEGGTFVFGRNKSLRVEGASAEQIAHAMNNVALYYKHRSELAQAENAMADVGAQEAHLARAAALATIKARASSEYERERVAESDEAAPRRRVGKQVGVSASKAEAHPRAADSASATRGEATRGSAPAPAPISPGAWAAAERRLRLVR